MKGNDNPLPIFCQGNHIDIHNQDNAKMKLEDEFFRSESIQGATRKEHTTLSGIYDVAG